MSQNWPSADFIGVTATVGRVAAASRTSGEAGGESTYTAHLLALPSDEVAGHDHMVCDDAPGK